MDVEIDNNKMETEIPIPPTDIGSFSSRAPAPGHLCASSTTTPPPGITLDSLFVRWTAVMDTLIQMQNCTDKQHSFTSPMLDFADRRVMNLERTEAATLGNIGS
ncbi:unnamed protein product [Ilex paraguariensis]|uniref:Uncharacterized protein n=1 Tax=Ilex paraguariensis TaxID=185542 RepID=A0ABC8TGG1_9AQUA